MKKQYLKRYFQNSKNSSQAHFLKRLLFFIIFVFFLNINPPLLYAQSESSGISEFTGINVSLGVIGCNNNGICEAGIGETPLSCPVDCAVAIPPPFPGGGSSGSRPGDIFIYNVSVQPNFTSAVIHWNSSVSTISAIKWGETTEVKDGILHETLFAREHQIEIINLKPGTLYYFTIESQDINRKTNLHPPIYFFTKFLIDTTFPLNPLNVKATALVPGINITWENPPDPDFSYVRIMRHEDRFRGDASTGKLIYEGSAEEFLDKNLIAGKKYFYTLFSRNKDGNYSGGVGVSATAYSPGGTPASTPEVPPEIFISKTFFVHQYNQPVVPLIIGKAIEIDKDKSTVVDINSKTFSDDFMTVTNTHGEIIGQYLFSFNADSERYQSVIPPLKVKGVYFVKIYSYIGNAKTLISEGSLYARENTETKIEQLYNSTYSNIYIYIIILFFILLWLIFFLKRRRKRKSHFKDSKKDSEKEQITKGNPL